MSTQWKIAMQIAAIRAMLVVVGIGFLSSAYAQNFTEYKCSDGTAFMVAFFENTPTAFLQLDGHAVQLPKRLAYTGSRYSKSGITFWVRKGRVTLKRAGKTVECSPI
jgi:membrane-bound inhibitor of C-type lysozyme